MARIACKVKEGLRPSEATVEVRDFQDRPERMPVDRDFLDKRGNEYFLPVSVAQIDHKRKLAVVTLPVEADSGAHRIWVKLTDLLDLEEALT